VGLLLPGYPDPQCGFKLMRRLIVPELITRARTDGFAFDTELLMRAERRGLVVRQFTVTWTPRLGSSVRALRQLPRTSLDLLRLVLGGCRAPAMGGTRLAHRLERRRPILLRISLGGVPRRRRAAPFGRPRGRRGPPGPPARLRWSRARRSCVRGGMMCRSRRGSPGRPDLRTKGSGDVTEI